MRIFFETYLIKTYGCAIKCFLTLMEFNQTIQNDQKNIGCFQWEAKLFSTL